MAPIKPANREHGGTKSNQDLRAFYDAVYKEGPERHFSNWQVGQSVDAVLSSADWSGCRVLDVGCGSGDLVRSLRAAGASHVVGVDFSEEAIRLASENTDDPGIEYVCTDVLDYRPGEKFDAITTLGTVEHLDDPAVFLRHLEGLLATKGKLVLTCPHFVNLRGIAWMTLALLQDVPMSLSDLHFVHPWDMARWSEKAGLRIEDMTTLDYSRGNGERLIEDFTKRIPNALRDAGLDGAGAERFLDYLRSLTDYVEANPDEVRLQGATACYVLTRRSDGEQAT